MPFAEIETSQRKARIVFEPAGFGLPYMDLFSLTDVSGYEMYVLESTNNFSNDFQRAMESKHKEFGWFGLILRDTIRNGESGADDKGRLNIKYVSHANTEWEKEHDVWAPTQGFYVPNDDCEKINGIVVPFQPGTIVPFETVTDKKEAIARFEKYGINPEYVSYFVRMFNYKDGVRFAYRGFAPPELGCFDIHLVGWPFKSNNVKSGAIPAFEEQKAAINVTALPEKKQS